MMRNLFTWVFLIALATATAVAQPPADSSIPPDSEIRKILAERIDKQRRSVGIAVGVVGPQGRRVVSYGSLGKDAKQAVNGDKRHVRDVQRLGISAHIPLKQDDA